LQEPSKHLITTAPNIGSRLRYPVFPKVLNRQNTEKNAEKVGFFLESARRGG
jgi:hypothetical protein